MLQAIADYYAALKQYGGLEVTHETALRSAMQALLADAGRAANWTLVPEQRLANGKVPDGTFRDAFNLARGYWEAKDTKDDLETEIRKKIALGYPLANMLFEDTRRAVLFQGRDNRFEFDLTKPAELKDLLHQFTSYAAPDIEDFYKAVDEFAARLPELAQGLMQCIETERAQNRAFTQAFDSFHDLCRNALNPTISAETIEEMLVQHLLTERLFRTIFENPDFTRRNIIASEIEKVIDALTSRAFNRQEFLRALDRYYTAIETKGRGITDWNEKQGFLNRVYERFFQGFSTKQADTHGIVYTPQEIVSFMCASVEHILKTEFGSSLSAPGVKILDPCTGTGNFVVNLLRHHISRRDMRQKYTEDIFANEIMLLPYYIATLNIEHAYYELSGEYAPFDGLCFADTLALAEDVQSSLFEEENTARTQREQDAPITVILGNPPYNVGQQNENDNNKNRRYKVVDDRIAKTYAKASKATNRNKLGDAYVKFFRWATDRLQGHDGILAFVSNNSLLEGIAFDGMRKCLLDEFTTIYHLDCGGNIRKNPKLSGSTHNVFGIQVGVGITILVRHRIEGTNTRFFYHAQRTDARASERLEELKQWGSIANVALTELTPDAKGNWLTEGMQADFDSFISLGTKETKTKNSSDSESVFMKYTLGVVTNRDSWVYDFNKSVLEQRVIRFIETYNGEVDRWKRAGKPQDVDSFVLNDGTQIKWSRDLKTDLKRLRHAKFDSAKVRVALYRPFAHRYYFFDSILSQDIFLLPLFFPNVQSETENVVICISGISTSKPFHCLVTNCLPDLHLTGDTQCFPFYVYNEDGTHRRENISNWALKHFQEAYGLDVAKWDIFNYIYTLMQDPAYRTRYVENVKHELPRIPISPLMVHSEDGSAASDVDAAAVFRRYVSIGEQLVRLHRDYEQAKEYPLQWVENRDVPFSWHVVKMKLSRDRTQIVVNESLTLAGIPAETFDYRLGNRSALEWVLDQYQITTDKRSGLVSDPNRPDDPEYIVRLVGKVVAVSVETVRLLMQLHP